MRYSVTYYGKTKTVAFAGVGDVTFYDLLIVGCRLAGLSIIESYKLNITMEEI